MAVTGRTPLIKWQAAIEATPGTILPATRVQPIVSGQPVEHFDKDYPVEQRGSLIKNYGNDSQIKQWVELNGLSAVPTFEDVPWFLQAFAKGAVTGDATAVTAFNYTFTPTTASDDLKTVNWEWGNDTQAFSIPFGVGTRWRFEAGVGKASVMTVDYVGQRLAAQALTSNLSLRVVEPIVGAKAKAYIDSSTIGSTQVYNVLDFSMELATESKQFWALDGNLYPRDAYRSASRSAMFEATLQFANTTEYVALSSNTTRKIRITIDGSAIAGTSPATNKRLTLDWYGPWAEAPFGEQDGLTVMKVRGESVYSTAAGHDWRIQVTNDLSSLA